MRDPREGGWILLGRNKDILVNLDERVLFNNLRDIIKPGFGLIFALRQQFGRLDVDIFRRERS